MSSGEPAYCGQCGAEIRANAEMCPECGTMQEWANATESAAGGAEGGSKAGTYLAYAVGVLFVFVGLGAVVEGTLRGIGAGLVGIGIGTAFFPVVRTKLGVSAPGIDGAASGRRNILVGAGYTFAGMVAVGAALPPTETDGGSREAESNIADGETGDGSTDTPSPTATPDPYADAWAYHEGTDVAFYDVTGTGDQYSTTISGEAVNASGSDYDYVQVSFGLYDAGGAKVGDALDNVGGLRAGGTWKFEAIGAVEGQKVDSFRLEEVSAY